MELAHSNEQSYQLELQAYQIIFPNFKHELSSFVSVEIGTSSKVPITPFVVQHVTKPISPLRGGTSFKIIPLHVQTFTRPIPMTTVVNQPTEGSERSDKEQIEHVNLSFTILDSISEFLEIISTGVPLTPHQIDIGQEVILISSTPHASEVFITPITTFENTPNRQKITAPTGLQILN